MKTEFIPYARHLIDQQDIDALIGVLQGDWLTGGPSVELFEEKLSTILNAREVIACANGTAALHLALLGLGMRPGDVVLVPAITFLASANAVKYMGGEVIFVDIDPNTGLMTKETLECAIKSNNTKILKGIINVHLGGQCEALEDIYQVAKQHALWIIDDAAHALGTVYIGSDNKNITIGSNAFSDVTIFSFHPVKNIATGEGGAVSTNNPEVAKKIRLFRSHGMVKEPSQWLNKDQGIDSLNNTNPWYYEMHELGYNYRISDINCALGLSQLRKLFDFKKYKQQLVKNYDEAFKQNVYLKVLKKRDSSNTCWHLYTIFIDFYKLKKTRAQFMKALSLVGIGTQVHYIPVYKQPYYQKQYGNVTLPGAEKYYERCLSLPLFAGLTEKQQDQVIERVLELCA